MIAIAKSKKKHIAIPGARAIPLPRGGIIDRQLLRVQTFCSGIDQQQSEAKSDLMDTAPSES